MKSTIISKIRKLVTEHPTLVTIGLGLAITFVIGAAIGMVDVHTAAARVQDQNTLVIPTLATRTH
jgi:hypothetical protein